jgi:histidinol dehydrogenase
MIRTVDLRGKVLSKAGYSAELPRANFNVDQALISIKPILERVKNGTESDLIALAEEFDGIKPLAIKVSQSDLDKALQNLDSEVRSALELSIVFRVNQTGPACHTGERTCFHTPLEFGSE